MATDVRNLNGLKTAAAVAAYDMTRLDALKLRAGLIYHADATTPVTLADIATGSTLAAQVAFTVACSAAHTAHIASACDATTGQGAHIAADAANVLTTPVPTTLAECYARMNEIKALHNLHVALTAKHAVADSTNTVSATDATTAATLATLGNQVKAKQAAHFSAAFTAQALNVTGA